METWMLCMLIAALGYIAFDHARLILRTRALENSIDAEEYLPQRLIMYRTKEGKHMLELYKIALKARREAGDEVRFSSCLDGYLITIFSSGDEVILYTEEAKINKLTKKQIKSYKNRVFVDYKLPDSAFRALIEQLGLRNYSIDFGICDETLGGK